MTSLPIISSAGSPKLHARSICLLWHVGLLPFLEAIDALISFPQSWNVFICDFIGALKRCQSQLDILYWNAKMWFRRDDFYNFNMLLQLNHESIPLKWDTNLNLLKKQLAFVFGD